MGKFDCTCGHTISLNSIPEFNRAILITDIALDNSVGDDVEAERQPHRTVIECDMCGRLWIKDSPRWDVGANWLSFAPEGDHLRFRDDYNGSFWPRPKPSRPKPPS
jgi:hypothetical protein